MSSEPPAEKTTDNGQRTTLPSSPVLQGEHVAFTGTLASMTHRQAQDLAEEHGGSAMQHVSRQTTMLVIGEEGWPLDPDGEPSQKLRQVQDLRTQGFDIKLVKESDWLGLLGLSEETQQIQRLYTPAMLSKLLNVPVGKIRSWERLGLIRAVRKVYRLPYFDFCEVTGARRLMELLESGISRQKLQESLENLKDIWPDIKRPLGQLEVLVDGGHVLYRDEAGLIEPVSRQRYLDFDETAGGERRAESGEPNRRAVSRIFTFRPALRHGGLDHGRVARRRAAGGRCGRLGAGGAGVSVVPLGKPARSRIAFSSGRGPLSARPVGRLDRTLLRRRGMRSSIHRSLDATRLRVGRARPIGRSPLRVRGGLGVPSRISGCPPPRRRPLGHPRPT